MSYLAPDSSSNGWKFGCGTVIAIPLLALGVYSSIWPYNRVPAQVSVNGVLASSSSWGLREGCEMAIYSLSERTSEALKREGLAALQPSVSGRARDLNHQQKWTETPGQIDVVKNGHGTGRTVYALYALGGCPGDSRGSYYDTDIGDALKAPGSYYRFIADGEGIFIVAPRHQLAAYYYFG